MKKEELHAAGEALFGTRWQSEMARALGIPDRTIRRYANGTVVPPDKLKVMILKLAEQRIEQIEAMRWSITD